MPTRFIELALQDLLGSGGAQDRSWPAYFNTGEEEWRDYISDTCGPNDTSKGIYELNVFRSILRSS